MTDTPETPTPPAKPVAPRRRTPRKAAATKSTSASKAPAALATTPASSKRSAPAKSRSTTRATPAPKRKTPAKAAPETPAPKAGGKWGKAAVVGGLAAVGAAATAALLSLRGSTPRDDKPKARKDGARSPDGTDASRSFSAEIADENSIPDKT